MKKIFTFKLTALLLMLMGTLTVEAQSTYTWDASLWSAINGTVSVADGKITGTSYQWGCIQIKTETTFKLPKRQIFIVIKGENLFTDSNNPNIQSINGVNYQAASKGFTGNEGHTLICRDITEFLPDEVDFWGNVTINSIAVTIDQDETDDASKAKMPIITSIDFVAADILDVAETSNISLVNNTDGDAGVTLTQAADGIKKTLKFTQLSNNGDMAVKFSGINALLNSSDMYFVVEANSSSLKDNGKMKLRSMKAGDTYTWEGTSTSASLREIDGHQVYIHSPYNANTVNSGSIRGMKQLIEAWETTPVMNTTEYTLYMKNTQNAEIEIYRMGFYNFSEICAMYPSLASEKWWFQKSEEGHCAMEIHNNGSNTEIKFNNGYGTANTNTPAYAAQVVRSLGGSLPSNFTKINFNGRFSFTTDAVPCSEDIFAELPETVTEISLGLQEVIYLPTMSQKVTLNDKNGSTKYYAFKDDGEAPASLTPTGSGSNWSSLTRTFKEGFNSVCLPFNKFQVESLPAGVTVYELNAYDSSMENITFTKVSSNVETNAKNIPYLINVETAGTYVLLGRDAESTFNAYNPVNKNNAKFVGSYVNQVPDGDYADTDNYGIDKDGNLSKMGSETKTTYYRAFLALPNGNSAKGITFSDTDVTGIEELKDSRTEELKNENSAVYDISGRRLSTVNSQLSTFPKGIYIRNGKKFIVK